MRSLRRQSAVIFVLGFTTLHLATSIQAQNLFESDGSAIYEFTPSGSKSTFASGLTNFGPGGGGIGVIGLAFDRNGNLFAADAGFSDILEFTPGGVESTFASGLGRPQYLAFDKSGNLFVSDSSGDAIYKITPGGIESTFASGLSLPDGLAFDSSGNLFEADEGTGNINEFTPGGIKSIFAYTGEPVSLAFDQSGNLFAGDAGHEIYEFTPGGIKSTFVSGSSGRVTGLAFDQSGNLFTTWANSSFTGYVAKFAPDGSGSIFASGLSPEDVAFGPSTVVSVVPEGSSLALLGGGLLPVAAFLRKKRRSRS